MKKPERPDLPDAQQTAYLRNQLADATILIWKLQNAVNEGNGPTVEIMSLSNKLRDRAASITGQVSRWALMAEESEKMSA